MGDIPEENIHDKIKQIFGEIPDFSILEEQIDLDLQLEYFECSRKVKEGLDPVRTIKKKDDIFNLSLGEEHRKTRFAELASMDEVEVYRTIEKYVQSGTVELRSWAILALQESRMLLESKLLGENQVFISTGLGGKEGRLRYFIVLINENDQSFNETQQKVIRNEMEIIMGQQEGEIEKLSFEARFVTVVALIPINVTIKEILKKTIKECNQFGNFLRENFIITNVKELNISEIEEFINNRNSLNNDIADQDSIVN